MKNLLSKIKTKLIPHRQNQRSMVKTILSREYFFKLIELERDRVHRTNRQFSLILIRVNGNNNGSISVTETVCKRVRRTDRIGWYDDSHIGVLLPNTTYAGAQVFLKDINQSHEKATGNMGMVIMSYPENL